MDFAPLEPVASRPRLPAACARAMSRHGIPPTRFILAASLATQRMFLFQKIKPPLATRPFPHYEFRRRFVISTSRFGAGQAMNSYQTPVGLHRVSAKIGGGQPPGAVFKGRQPVGFTWQGQPDGAIVHRILWLEGLEPGLNRGGSVDTFLRYIYIHGFGDETTLGRPVSRGCLHLGAKDLLPLFDLLPGGTLVWIGGR